MKIEKLSFFFFISLLYFLPASLFAFLDVDSSIPQNMQVELNELYKASTVIHNFKIEKDSANNVLIISEDGMIRRVPFDKVTSRDVMNIIETMEEELVIIRENKKKRVEPAPIKTPAYIVQKPSFTEFFPSLIQDKKFSVGFLATTEENNGIGGDFSVRFSFLRTGLSYIYGKKISFNSTSIEWSAYGVHAEAALFRFWNFVLSAGEEIYIYKANSNFFEKDYTTVSLIYSGFVFSPEIRFRYAPADIILVTKGENYKTEKYNILFLMSFLF